MKKLTTRELIPDACILILFLISLLWVYFAPTKQNLSVELDYKSAEEGILAQLFWGEGGALSAENCSDGMRTGNAVIFDLPQSPDQVGMLRIDPSNTEAVYSIYRIAFLINGDVYYSMNAQEILENYVPVNASAILSENELILTPANTDSGLFLDSEALTQRTIAASDNLHTLQVRQRFFAMLLLSVVLCILVHFAAPIAACFKSLFSKDENGRFDWFSLFATAVMAGALLVVVVIGLFSDLGLHPDEWDVKACLDYGMTHFLPPDMRDPEAAFTYSGYGYTKLINYTWYFFLAGKVAWLFRKMFYAIAYYRVPNILLFAALSCFFVRNIKKQKWLMVAVGICVQAWYIFSYTTADALDFFWAVLAIYELSVDNSLLYRTISAEKIDRRSLPGFLLLGLLFGMIALGKPNYLAVLALVFFVLVFRLIRVKKEAPDKARCLWRNYWIIVGIFALVFISRAGFDVFHYGLDKASVRESMSLIYSDYDKNPGTPIEEQSPSYHMMSKGATLSDFFAENPEWFSMSYKSFCDVSPLTDTPLGYFVLMGLLYAAIYFCIAAATLQRGSSLWGKIEFATGSLLMAGGLIASVLNSYIIDSQAQGRYLLPMVLIAGYLSSRTPQLFEKWYFRVLLIAAGMLSVACFGLTGVPMFL